MTALVQDRPYRIASSSVPPKISTSDIALNRPTESSSDATGHSSRFANDGDRTTFWESRPAIAAWWLVDFESRSHADEIHLLFADAKNYRYQIQISNDGTDWRTLLDRRATDSTAMERTESLPKNAEGRLLKIVFDPFPDGSVVRLSEVQVEGSRDMK